MNFFRKNLPLNRRSQIAVIITFVIAVIILFTAVFINISKVSQVKTSTSQAVDKSALGLASQLGSMSRYYKEKILKIGGVCPEPCQVCGLSDWVPLAAVILTAIATAIAAFVFFPLVFVGAAAGAVSMALLSSMVLSGINAKFKEMSGYNAMRESALFQSLSATQSDDVELKAKTPGSGVFYEDSNNNGVFDTGEPVYNLKDIPEMLNEKKASRFLAWYYTKRLPLVTDESMKGSIAVFISGIKGFIDADERDAGNNITKLSFLITPKSGERNYEVTCSGSSCPDWVKDAGTGKLRIVRMDSSAVYGGFLKDKLSSLLSRLETKYNGFFCEGEGCKIKPSDLNILIDQDLKMFLFRCKEVLDTPVSERLSSISQWYPYFYDPTKHNADTRESIDGKDDYDVYLRLSRDINRINTMINGLEALNNSTIKPGISDNHGGYCEEGRPDSDVVYNCFTAIASCSCWHTECGEYSCWKVCDGNKCETSLPARWHGNYGTCTGSGFDHSAHPVCQNGDLFGGLPNWCNNLKSVSCVSNNDSCDRCSPPPTSAVTDNSYNFQGQMSWENTSGPTEVEQAIRILRALNDDISKIKLLIKDLAEAAMKQLPSRPYEPYTDTNGNGVHDAEEPFYDLNGNTVYDTNLLEFLRRTEIVYAWKDKPVEGKTQYSHLARVRIDGYPDNLPGVTESVEWFGAWMCRTLNNYQGDVKITTSRYDQDQPTDIAEWQLRRRKQPGEEDFNKRKLEPMINDIQNTGKLSPGSSCCADCHGSYCQSDIDELLNNYAITSCSTAHYGPEKSDIYIAETKCD